MESSPLLTVLLPVALGTVMLGLGLSLTVGDFTRVARSPRAVLCALFCQVLLLPAVCFGLVVALDLAPALAVGMMLLAASPGGTTANLYSHLSGGDVALNISLTAVNSVISVVTLPIVVNLSLAHFMGGTEDAVGLRFSELVQVFAVVLVPVFIGMFLRNRYPAFAARCDRPVKILSAVFLVLVVLAAVLRERENVVDYFAEVGLAALLFSVISLTVGYWLPRLLAVGRRQSIAIGMEIGIHNSTLAIAIALSPTLLDNSEMAIPPAVYAIVAFGTAAVFGYTVSRRRSPETASASAPDGATNSS